MERDDWHLLKRYYNGECTPEELRAVPPEASTATARHTFAALLQAVDLKADTPPIEDGATAYTEFARRITKEVEPVSPAKRGSWSSLRISMASMVAVLLVGGAAFGLWHARFAHVNAPINETVYTAYRTAPAQRSTVNLADGSTMLLAPATSVHVTDRTIVVSGEAYFTVAPNARRPFIVTTTSATVHVLGTSFAVRQYAEERTARIVVENGRVAVRPRGDGEARETGTVLSSRMMAQVSDSGVTVSSGIATAPYTSWTRGMLVFDWVALRDVVAELGRAYNVDIQIADSALATRTVVLEVSLERNPVSEVLDVIGDAVGAHYTRNGRTYVVAPGRSSVGGSRIVPNSKVISQPEKQYGR